MYREGNPFNLGRYRLKHTQRTTHQRTFKGLKVYHPRRRPQWPEARAWSADLPDVVATGVRAAAEAHRAVAMEELLEESAAGQPHPAACVHAKICIQEQLIKYLDGEGETISLLGDLMP